MGKVTGFMEFERRSLTEEQVSDRIEGWCEFSMPWDKETLQTQAARCMDCGTPFCHAGRLLNGMTAGCPLHNLIPEWNDLVYRGGWHDALSRLFKTNPFPEFTGRVCPAPCEGSCTLGLSRNPVAIKAIEKSLADMGFEEDWIQPNPPQSRTGRTVAVVGSGPAGLACAWELNQEGHSVTVLERADRIGGLLMYGIPNMKLDKEIVNRRVEILKAEGIRFITGVAVGTDILLEQLHAEYDAVVLCAGATKPRELQVEGRQLAGVHQAMDYLTSSTRSVLSQGMEEEAITACGKDVVVIGGGDTGTDCVATAIRQGCRSVTQLEIMPQAPLSRGGTNPWPEWPKVRKTDYGQAEAIERFGQDPRCYQIATTRLEGDAGDRVTTVRTIQVEWQRDEAGRMLPVELAGSENSLSAQLVLLALGFTGPEEALAGELGLERDERSNIRTGGQAEAGSYMTSVEGIFAAGDIRRGPSLVAWAIDEGRQAAREASRYVLNANKLQKRSKTDEIHVRI
ncbi:glutamate synthase subunit beta [Paenibacillus massiliensis]|uniref:glutamate synthase subunit beta n=1 Tax=Paenibacillus massiliensis TaxID=225917 RepID=UPI0004203D4D|nr:glutamate synthase subunit beta [Paenibacillus massiliensis]